MAATAPRLGSGSAARTTRSSTASCRRCSSLRPMQAPATPGRNQPRPCERQAAASLCAGGGYAVVSALENIQAFDVVALLVVLVGSLLSSCARRLDWELLCSGRPDECGASLGPLLG